MNSGSANVMVFWTIESIFGWPMAYAEAYYEHKICFVSCRLYGCKVTGLKRASFSEDLLDALKRAISF